MIKDRAGNALRAFQMLLRGVLLLGSPGGGLVCLGCCPRDLALHERKKLNGWLENKKERRTDGRETVHEEVQEIGKGQVTAAMKDNEWKSSWSR